MSLLKNKRILIGVTSGIAAYKAAELVRLFIKERAVVRVMMTPHAQEFVSSLTFSALTHQRVYTELFDETTPNAMPHIELAKWAELIIIAPATANTMAELAHGLASNLVTTTCLATNIMIMLAPAMNREMWENVVVQKNVDLLKNQGKKILEPREGDQACGDFGLGCMAESASIFEEVQHYFSYGESISQLLLGKQILITAGPTQEALDPVRFISNYSSGKMGYAIAEAAIKLGAQVTLISGPTNLLSPEKVQLIRVTSAEEMLNASIVHSANKDIFIAAAAVSDYRAEKIETEKIKKEADILNLKLVKNPDVLKTISELKQIPYIVGFAAETSNLIHHARKKLLKKNLNLIIANIVGAEKGFGKEENELIIIKKEKEWFLPHNTKKILAEQLLHIILEDLQTG